MSKAVIAIFDVGKTNKKLFLFDEEYEIVYEKSARFAETVDEDGYPCENLESLRLSVFDSLMEVFRLKEFSIKAINFSSYGASLVYLDEGGKALTPLYNYLKPYPQQLHEQFYTTWGGEDAFSKCTASPVLGSLNAGLQLYRIKQEKPELFEKIKWALHFPQYLSQLITGSCYSDLTSIGCHTGLWDFEKQQYHPWVKAEGLAAKLAPIAPYDHTVPSCFPGATILTGIGLHDSSAALIPYLESFHEPFVLISTGTWCISLNPFNQQPLTVAELANDCLCYLDYKGRPVKASRLFAGMEHEQQVKRIAAHFNQGSARFRSLHFDAALAAKLQGQDALEAEDQQDEKPDLTKFGKRELSAFASSEEAYHRLIMDLVREQVKSTQLVLKKSPVKRIFLDGGFSKNSVYMNLLASAFPNIEVYAASMAQATAAGTALAIHKSWNTKPMPTDIIKLKFYTPTQKALV
ncbi:FGGY-family carbohydrate kinase [Cesiribacter sp. SM1]|uniref:FGGY-family carbohydrate kinase n=1 Tax=Cesiribacter sp. SM1 TaxID=2861196 RepID=UPI001CD5F7F7|nr:FGGY family carbohydrate kinase [Cesiribacter sp. SM1]